MTFVVKINFPKILVPFDTFVFFPTAVFMMKMLHNRLHIIYLFIRSCTLSFIIYKMWRRP